MTEAEGFSIQSWSAPSFDDEGEAEQSAEAGPAGEPGEREFVPALGIPAAAGAGPEFEEQRPSPGATEGAEPDFASIKFQRENTLLSNAEKYAASIREEAELYVAQIRREVDALNAEAEQRYAEASRVKDEAQRQAEQLIASAQQQVAAIQQQARQEGLQAGEAEGIRRRYEEAQPYLIHLEEILEELSQYRRQVAYYAEKDAIRLSVIMAKKVLLQELKLNKKVVWNLLAKTLSTLEGQGAFKVWLNPEDFRFAKQARPALEKFLDEDQSLIFRAKAGVPPGNVQIETDREVIDLTFQSQFHYLESLLNQALAERETMVLKRPASATPSIGARQGQAAVPPPAAKALDGDDDTHP
jgi:flagellar assembly protein FliH